MESLIQYVFYFVVLTVLAIPLGSYMGKVMNGEKHLLTGVLGPVERFIYRAMGIDSREEMSAKKYAVSVIAFHVIGFILLFLLLMCQGLLPLNPQGMEGFSWHQAFNTAVSFVTNTNWQSYSGEEALSYLTQMLGMTVQNFVSAGAGIAVLFAVIRGFTRVNAGGIGNFWVDLTRIVLYILLPLSIVSALLLCSQGVVQTLKPYEEIQLLEPVMVGNETVTEQLLPLGPAASQIAIKQLGTNGGGFFGANGAHPLENPTVFSNLIEMLSLLLIPAGLCFTFGRNVKDKRQGVVIFAAMAIMLTAFTTICAVNEQAGTPQLAQNGAVAVDVSELASGGHGETGTAGGNMEGKETRFGIASSVTWTAWTTAASNGSVNSMLDSYTPLGGLAPMLQMQLGEVIFGGAGCGLYGMLAFAVLAVFIAGLMVGRTPEYLGKKIEPFEMKMASLCCLATPLMILLFSGLATLVPAVDESLNNGGAHGFSEVLYAFSSVGGNNGSAFAGFRADTTFLHVTMGLVMLGARFIPMLAMLSAAGSLARKKRVAQTAGTLSTCNGLFLFLLIFVVLLVGALSFFPALALGPVAEYFQMAA